MPNLVVILGPRAVVKMAFGQERMIINLNIDVDFIMTEKLWLKSFVKSMAS